MCNKLLICNFKTVYIDLKSLISKVKTNYI